MFPPAILLPMLALLRSSIWGVMRPLGDRTRRAPFMWRPEGKLIPERLVRLIQTWLERRREMIEALMERLAAGTHIARPYKPREARPGAIAKPRIPQPPEKQLPRGFGWINLLASEVGPHAHGLRQLLNDTEMKAMVIASPQMARLWAPLLNALSLPKPNWLPKPPKRLRKPQPRIEKPAMTGMEMAAEAIRLSQPLPSPEGPAGPPSQLWRRVGEPEAPRPRSAQELWRDRLNQLMKRRQAGE